MQPLQQDNEFIVMQIKDVLTPTKIKRLSESDTTFGIFVPGKWQVVHAFPLTSRFSCSEPELIENLRQPALVRLVLHVCNSGPRPLSQRRYLIAERTPECT